MNTKRLFRLASVFGIGFALSACSSSSDDPVVSVDTDLVFEITVTNLSANQPMSPAVLALHQDSYQAFETGASASVALEQLAEGGDNSALLASLASSDQVLTEVGGAGAIAPGGSELFELSADDNALGTLSLSVLSMLVNTNDAVVAVNSQSLASMAVNETQTFYALSYDAGTEANTETADTIPGPAAAGGAREGFNATRDDIRDEISVHAGVVTQDDGLSTSVLTQANRWDHPSVRVSVVRVD